MKISHISCNNYNFNIFNKNSRPYTAREKNSCPYARSNVNNDCFVSFTSLKQTADNENLFIDTAFYRDFPTLTGFAGLLRDEFPDGTDIMDFACSNGEEAISLYSLINDKNDVKYKIYCYDTSDKALDFAKNNIYSVNSESLDYFLINNCKNNKTAEDLKKRFYVMMQEIEPPEFRLHDEAFLEYSKSFNVFNEKYFKVKDEYKHNFKFKKGDIRDILNIQPDKQVGAIFFRNALYHLTNNHPFGNIYDRETLDKIWFTNKEEVLQNFADNVYEKLLPGGFLVLGNDIKEHLYQADKFTPKDEIYFDASTKEYIRLKSPLVKALKKDGKFKPVLSSKCYSSEAGDFTVYTIWQKNK